MRYKHNLNSISYSIYRFQQKTAYELPIVFKYWENYLYVFNLYPQLYSRIVKCYFQICRNYL